MSRVFISSTSLDLPAYRQAAVEVCNRLELIPIAMEFFGAIDQSAIEECLRKVRESDVYIGIFAHRYGFIPSGQNQSITEMEFDEASKKRIARLCFVVDPTYPWSPTGIDYQSQDKLQDFKKRIDHELIRDYFTTVDDFKYKLYHALSRWNGNAPVSTTVPPFDDASLLPPQPPLLVGREKDFTTIKSRLGTTGPRENLVIVRGWPGVGKTTLVNALAYDSDLQRHFSDGILWAALGEHANPFAELKQWGQRMGVGDIGPDLKAACQRLRTLFAKKRVLLIVDDVWRAEDGIPFKLAGPESSMLITTRFPAVANEIANRHDQTYVLEQLTNETGLQLLTQLAPNIVYRYPTEATCLVSDLEGLPLAIRVAGRLLEAEIARGGNVATIIQELRTNHHLLLDAKAPDDRFDPYTGTTPTVNLLIQQSTRLLDDASREYFAMLGAFAPKPATFDLGAISAVWDTSNPMPIVRKLVDRGLLEFDERYSRYLVHAVLVMHAKTLLAGAAPPPFGTEPNLEEIKHLETRLKILKSQLRQGRRVQTEINTLEMQLRRLRGNTPAIMKQSTSVSHSQSRHQKRNNF